MFFRTERVEELGVDMTKYRAYDYAIGRFWQADPAADMAGQESWTPYQYGFNNPIKYSDPYGDCPTCPNLIIGLITKYAAIASPGIVATKNIYNGSSGFTPSGIEMSDRTRSMVKISGVASDGNTIKETGVALAKEGSKDLVNAADKGGEALSDAGVVAAPFTGGASMALVLPGEIISGAGKAVKVGINLSEGDLDAAAGETMNLGVGLVTSGLTDAAIKQSRKVGNITNQAEDVTQESILSGLSSLMNKVTSYITGGDFK